MRSALYAVAAVALLAVGCRSGDSVRVAWDAPIPTASGYRILVDGRVVMTIAPPALDPVCACAAVWVPVPRGEHIITVIAYNEFGDSAPAAVTVVRRW